jgi:uncharacterized protein YigE (DUF2233 family)
MSIAEKFMVTATGTKDGKPYTSLSRLVQGSKANGDRYSFLDQNRTMREQEEIPVGTIVEYSTTRAAVTATPAATGGFPDTPVARSAAKS